MFSKFKVLAFLLLALLSLGASSQTENTTQIQLKNSKISIDSTSLVLYASQGNLPVVNLLIDVGVLPSEPEPLRKVTPLFAAASQGHTKVITALLKFNVSINAEDICGYTPLMAAAYFGQFEAVSLLLQSRKASLDHRARCGLTPLIAAVQSGNIKVVDALLVAGAKPNIQDIFGNTALKSAQQGRRVDMEARIQTALMSN